MTLALTLAGVKVGAFVGVHGVGDRGVSLEAGEVGGQAQEKKGEHCR